MKLKPGTFYLFYFSLKASKGNAFALKQAQYNILYNEKFPDNGSDNKLVMLDAH